MSVNREQFNQISPSEFFYRNRDLAGFSNPTRSLYTAVREFVENSLDACDQRGILPNVRLKIKPLNPDVNEPRLYTLTVADNGPGIEAAHVPLAFGTVLYGSKFGLKQARGMFGLGATMAILYGQITANKPVMVSSSADAKTRHNFKILLDIQKNKPIIQEHTVSDTRTRGLKVSIVLLGDYSKAGAKIRDYVYQTSLITPYATISFHDPKDNIFRYKRIIADMPKAPTLINPHPRGVDVETIRRMVVESRPQILQISDDTISHLFEALRLKDRRVSLDTILAKSKRAWKRIGLQNRLTVSLMATLRCKPKDMTNIRIDEIDIINGLIYYYDIRQAKADSVGISDEDPFGPHIRSVAAGEMLQTFLTKRFQRVGTQTAERFSKFAGFKPERRMGTMTNQDLVLLSDSLQRYDDFISPDPSCLAPLGSEPLEKGLKQFFEPDFLSVIQRHASAYSGFPFVIEMGIAYGGNIQTRGIKTYRFANRIPLLYDEGSDVVLKVIHELDWNRYKVKHDAPLVVASHICSTRIPYKTVGKENVADRPEIEKELKLALQYLARRLSGYMSKRGKAEAARKRANLYSKYIPLISQFCTELAGEESEPSYKTLFKEDAYRRR